MRKLSLLLALTLAACGGGSVNCTGTSACVFNVTGNTVTGTATIPAGSVPSGAASTPGGAASTPSGGASSPTPSTIPLALFKQTFPVTATAGDLRFTAGGITYLVAVVSNGEASWVALYSAPAVGDSVQMVNVEAMLDGGLDLHMPAADDAALRAYLASVVIPKLNAWMLANSGRFVDGLTLPPVNTSANPTGSAASRLAGRIPQWIDINPFGAALK